MGISLHLLQSRAGGIHPYLLCPVPLECLTRLEHIYASNGCTRRHLVLPKGTLQPTESMGKDDRKCRMGKNPLFWRTFRSKTPSFTLAMPNDEC